MSEELLNPSGRTRVGEQLRQLREQSGMSLAETAERLHVLPSYVNAMETGHYGNLPGTVFLRGYVRSYARLLKLDEEDVVARLDLELGIADQEVTQAASAKAKTPAGRSHSGVWVLLLVLAAAAVVFWFYGLPRLKSTVPAAQSQAASSPAVTSSQQATEQPSAETVAPQQSSAATPVAEMPAQQGAASDSGAATDAAAVATDNAETVQIPVVVAPQEAKVIQPSATPKETEPKLGEVSPNLPPQPAPAQDAGVQPAPAAPDTTAKSEVTDTPTSSAADTTTAEPAATAPAADVAAARLLVKFRGDCWFTLEDAAGNKRVGLFHAGDHLTHSGPAPFKIVVGAADVTDMEFNDQPVDYTQYRVWNNRVGLTLGK